jgi:hypothetical protein
VDGLGSELKPMADSGISFSELCYQKFSCILCVANFRMIHECDGHKCTPSLSNNFSDKGIRCRKEIIR